MTASAKLLRSNSTALAIGLGFGQRNALTLFFATFAFWLGNGWRTLQDPDTYWHIIVGKRIWDTGDFPRVDDYSYTLAGAHWIAKEWLSQLAFYGAYSWAGWFGVVFLTAAVASAAYAALFAWLSQRVNPLVALTMAVVCMSLTVNSLLARPQIFFFLLLSLCACGLVGAVESRKTPWWLIPLTAVWANLHASFPIAIVLAALFGLEAVASAASGQRARTGIGWAAAVVGASAAAGATPYGYESLSVSFRIVGGTAINYIDEWRPIGFGLHGAYAAAFLLGSAAILAVSRVGWMRAAPVAMCGYLMVRHVRFFSLFGIVATAALAGPVAKAFPRFAAQRFTPTERLRNLSSIALVVAFAVAAAVAALAPRPVPAASITPSAAFDAARAAGVSGPVYNDYGLGGYLIFRGVKTFIDGRAELFLGGLFDELHEAESDPADEKFLSLLARYHATWALAVHDGAGASKLGRSSEWKSIYHDDVADVFVRQ